MGIGNDEGNILETKTENFFVMADLYCRIFRWWIPTHTWIRTWYTYLVPETPRTSMSQCTSMPCRAVPWIESSSLRWNVSDTTTQEWLVRTHTRHSRSGHEYFRGIFWVSSRHGSRANCVHELRTKQLYGTWLKKFSKSMFYANWLSTQCHLAIYLRYSGTCDGLRNFSAVFG